MTITAKALLLQAQQQTGLSDFGDDWFLGPLGAYVTDLEADHLSDFGRTFLARQAVKDLARRLRIVDCLKHNPGIEETPLPPILYATGHERSGTTLLHKLLALRSGARFLSRWELMLPTPPPEAANFQNDPRRLQVRQSIDALRGTDLENMHWVEAEDPEECVWGFMDCTGIVGMAPSLLLPAWEEWVTEKDLTPTFTNYRKIVQLLTWKNPVPEGGFLVLKAPQLTRHLAQFLSVFPEARFIYLHRDPYRVLTSFCTLLDIVNGPFLRDPDYLLNRDLQDAKLLRRMGMSYAGMTAFEDSHPDRVINLQYLALVDEPAAELTRFFEQAAYAKDADLEDRVEEFLGRQKSGGRAEPRKELSDHGYTREAVECDPQIEAYLRRYHVRSERTRNTGTK